MISSNLVDMKHKSDRVWYGVLYLGHFTRGREHHFRNLPVNSSFHPQQIVHEQRLVPVPVASPPQYHTVPVPIHVTDPGRVLVSFGRGLWVMKIMKVSELRSYAELLIQQLLYRIRSSKNTELLFRDGSSVRPWAVPKEWFAWKCPCPPKQPLLPAPFWQKRPLGYSGP